jgi:DNA-binding beta-propeller fold protein YncE
MTTQHRTTARILLGVLAIGTLLTTSAYAGGREPVARHADAARCGHGGRPAVIAGKRVCLRVGARCRKRYERQYQRYGFHCQRGRLTRRALPKAGTITATIPVAGSPSGLIHAAGSLWVARHRAGTVARIDPATNRIVAQVPISSGLPTRFAFGAEGLWLENYSDSTVAQIDPATNRVIAQVAGAGENCCAVAVGAGSIWAQQGDPPNVLTRIDAATKKVSATIAVRNFFGVLFAYDSAWGTSGSNVVRIDPHTNAVVARVSVPGLSATSLDTDLPWMAAGANGIWVSAGRSVARIDPTTNRLVAVIPIVGVESRTWSFVAASDNAVWVVGPRRDGSARLWRIDPATNAVVGELLLSKTSSVEGLAVGEGAVWVSLFDTNKVLRIAPS